MWILLYARRSASLASPPPNESAHPFRPFLSNKLVHKVEHHTGAHGQRYNADTSKASSVDGLVTVGARKISAWASRNGAEAAAQQILSEKLDGKSATKARARDIP